MQQWRKNLIIMWFGQFIVMAGMSLIMPFLPLYIEQDMGISDVKQAGIWAGLIFGANFLTASIASPIWGKLADRHGRKLMVLRSGFGMAIVTILTGLSTSVYHLLALRLLNGIISGFIPAGIALVATNSPKERIGYSLGILQSGAVAGSIMGPFIGGLLAEFIGYRQIFNITGVMILLAAFLVLFLVKENFTPEAKPVNTSMLTDIRSIFSINPMPSLFSTAFMIQISLLSITPVFPLFIKQLHPSGEYISFIAGTIVAITGFSNMLSSPLLGKMGDRYGSEKVLLYTMLGISLFILPQAFVMNIWQLAVLRFLQGLCLGGLLPSVNALIRQFSPEGMESRVYGLNNSAVSLGNMTGPIIGGFIGGFVGIKEVFLFSGIMFLLNTVWVRYSVQKAIRLRREQDKLPA